jgi:hypothetical protein
MCVGRAAEPDNPDWIRRMPGSSRRSVRLLNAA